MADSSIINLPNEMVVKPDPGDKFALANISVPSAGETQKIAYSTLTADFLMTNEARTMTAGGLTVNDGIKIKMGTDGDLEFYHSNPISYIANTKTSGKIHIQATNGASALVDMLILDPTGPTIAIGAANVANANNSTHGFTVDASGNLLVKKILDCTGKIQCHENIDLDTNFISGDGADHGLSASGEDVTISGNLTVDGTECELNCALDLNGTANVSGKLTMGDNVIMGTSNYISDTGTNARGLGFTNVGGGMATLYQHFTCKGETYLEEFLSVSSYIESTSYIRSNSYVRAGSSFDVRDSIATPATVAGYARIYVHSADGDLKVRFGDGTIKTIVTNP